jgi:hypothetical protein
MFSCMEGLEGGSEQSSEDEYRECIRRLEIGAWGEHRSESQNWSERVSLTRRRIVAPWHARSGTGEHRFGVNQYLQHLWLPQTSSPCRQSTRFVALSPSGQETIHVRVNTCLSE